MRRFTVRLLVAVIAFVVGVTAATLLGGFSVRRASVRRFRVERVVRTLETPARSYECGLSRRLSEPPAPRQMPEMPEPPPLAPGVPPAAVSRIVIQRADGTVQVIEPRDARGK